MRLKGSVVVVTGATSGIGRATALRLASAGADVVVAGRRAEVLDDVVAECRRRGAQALPVPVDVAECDDVSRLGHRALNRFGRIDAWVNAAAVTVFSPFMETSLEEFRRVLDVNVMGCVHGVRVALPVMERQGSGVIVNVSSVLGAVPAPYQHAYVMSKSAIGALGASLRQELRLRKVRGVDVVTVMPPSIDTPIYRVAANHTGHEIHPLPPLYTAEKVAKQIERRIRRPRREVVVGALPRLLVAQARTTPGVVERAMGSATDLFMVRRGSAPDTSGNLFETADEPREARVDGGWHGRRRTAQRVLLGTAAGAAIATAATRRSARTDT